MDNVFESVFLVFLTLASLLASSLARFVLPWRQVAPQFLPTESGFSRPPSNPSGAAFSEVLALGDKTLMKRAGEQGDAMPINLIAKVLTGDTDL